MTTILSQFQCVKYECDTEWLSNDLAILQNLKITERGIAFGTTGPFYIMHVTDWLIFIENRTAITSRQTVQFPGHHTSRPIFDVCDDYFVSRPIFGVYDDYFVFT